MAKISEVSVGKVFGRLVVIALTREQHFKENGSYSSRPYAICDCTCGTKNVKVVIHALGNLQIGCGCTRLEKLRQAVKTHGRCGNDKVCTAWRAMKQRCHYKSGDYYHLYGEEELRYIPAS